METGEFSFRVEGLRGSPGVITEGASTRIPRLLHQVDGVLEVTYVEHPENRLDNSVEVRLDPDRTDLRALAARAQEVWEITWFQCHRCGGTAPERRISCGVPMEEFP